MPDLSLTARPHLAGPRFAAPNLSVTARTLQTRSNLCLCRLTATATPHPTGSYQSRPHVARPNLSATALRDHSVSNRDKPIRNRPAAPNRIVARRTKPYRTAPRLNRQTRSHRLHGLSDLSLATNNVGSYAAFLRRICMSMNLSINSFSSLSMSSAVATFLARLNAERMLCTSAVKTSTATSRSLRTEATER